MIFFPGNLVRPLENFYFTDLFCNTHKLRLGTEIMRRTFLCSLATKLRRHELVVSVFDSFQNGLAQCDGNTLVRVRYFMSNQISDLDLGHCG